MKIKLADVTVEIKNLYAYAEDYCKEYVAPETAIPDLSFAIGEEDVVFEREKSAREDVKMGLPIHDYSDGYLESLAIYRKIAEVAPSFQTLLFHGSAIAVDGSAYLFTAKSGTGKSTHARLWRELLGSRATMINDDKPLIRITPRGPLVCGTPWNGKHHLDTNVSAPLKAICLLERGTKNEIHPISFVEAYPLLLQQCYRPASQEMMQKTLNLLSNLGQSLRFYRLRCNVEPEAAAISFAAMSEKKGAVHE